MKHLSKLSPATRNLLAALVILAVLYPALTAAAIHGAAYCATWIGTAAAAILIARISPEKTHDKLHRATGTTVATWITGHKPEDETESQPARSYKHAPSSVPEVPVTR